MKEKLKNSLTISEKDKKLLVYVFAFLIIFIAYFVGYQNLSASLDTSTKQVTELTKKKKDLQTKNDNKAKYESDTLSLQSDSSKLLKTFENGDRYRYVPICHGYKPAGNITVFKHY